MTASRRQQLLAGMTAAIGSAFGAATPLQLASPWAERPDGWGSLTMANLYPEVDPEALPDLLPLTESTAMSVPPIAKARHMVVTGVSTLPLLPRAPRERNPQLLHQLDPARPNVVTLALVTHHMFFHGHAWLRKIGRDTMTDRPLALRYVASDDLERDPKGYPVRIISTGETVTLDDLVLIEGIHPGVLAAPAGLTIRRASRTDRAAARAMDNPVPSIELHQTMGDPLDDERVDKLIARWAKARRGENGGVAYTSPSIETKTHGQAAEQLLINGRNASALDCARICGVPAWVVDASTSGSSLTYSNVPSRSREFLDYTLRGYLQAIAGRLSMDDVTPHGQGVRFDVTPLLRGDFRERMEAGKVAVDAGIYDATEIRAMDDDTPTVGSRQETEAEL